MIQSEVSSKNPIRLLYSGESFKEEALPRLEQTFFLHQEPTIEDCINYLKDQSLFNLPDVIVMEVDDKVKSFEFIRSIKKDPLLKGLVIVLLSKSADPEIREMAMKHKVNDLYVSPVPLEDLCERIIFLVKFKLIKPQMADLAKIDVTYKIPIYKRIFDIVSSGMVLLVLSPFLLIVAIIIAIESKGPIIFKSKRVGTGYQVFDFYKFRSMRANASNELQALSNELNQYDKSETGATTFVKLKNDPRITKFGHFIRKYSIDELPQLLNVFFGDMSVVGNRPLPLYEAEMLTSNEWSMRFLGPAGLTGLWQVSRRGKADMSERERKKLDNFYAQNYSFWLDFKIILQTFPAVVQKEQV
ncbi:sugar transferase [Pedobacter sp. MC2016-14]|uniref:sugar transferase n=1 Tax=Pedobacter sp. MC2016-14 TaxID=2897327 RepID=UPI001E433E4D|nr:sugar transferase [Pedobacter sp. MC2016-14]MCD0490226.1 sugar transferase [Pedobacter sp. MC2016-14]